MTGPITLVSNDPALLATLPTALLQQGWGVRCLRAGLGVHEVLRREAPALIVVSLTLGQDALQALLVQSILAEPALRTTPVALYVDAVPAALVGAIAQRSDLVLMAHPATAASLLYAVEQLSRVAACPDDQRGSPPQDAAPRAAAR